MPAKPAAQNGEPQAARQRLVESLGYLLAQEWRRRREPHDQVAPATGPVADDVRPGPRPARTSGK